MNYKSAQARLLSIFLVIGVFFVTILNWEFTVNAQINDNHSSAFNIENDDYNGTCVGKTRISLVSSKKHFLWEENILATYYVSSNESIADISYTQTGFNVISVGVDADNPAFLGPSENALIHHVPDGVGKQGHNINAHRLPSPQSA